MLNLITLQSKYTKINNTNTLKVVCIQCHLDLLPFFSSLLLSSVSRFLNDYSNDELQWKIVK